METRYKQKKTQLYTYSSKARRPTDDTMSLDRNTEASYQRASDRRLHSTTVDSTSVKVTTRRNRSNRLDHTRPVHNTTRSWPNTVVNRQLARDHTTRLQHDPDTAGSRHDTVQPLTVQTLTIPTLTVQPLSRAVQNIHQISTTADRQKCSKLRHNGDNDKITQSYEIMQSYTKFSKYKQLDKIGNTRKLTRPNERQLRQCSLVQIFNVDNSNVATA